jgi:galactokinase
MTEIISQANGRVNLIGEHTDYNGGWVLPTAIPQSTQVRLKLRDDKTVIATTTLASQKGHSSEHYKLGEEKARHSWLDYIQGATFLLAKAGHSLSGFEVWIDSSVPTGSGLSSSAALEISLLKALKQAFELPLTDAEMALVGQKIENEFVGANVGIMDQMACALANFGEALFLDTKTLRFERVALPLEQMDLVVINSGVVHNHSTGDYNTRRAECERACVQLQIPDLRSLNEKDLSQLVGLSDLLARRARHVITENARVHAAVAALASRDLKTLGQLFYASHASMRDDYQVSVPEIDLLVELSRQKPQVFGARLTGGGFGGSIVAITQKGEGRAVAQKVTQEYQAKTKRQPQILVPNHLS